MAPRPAGAGAAAIGVASAPAQASSFFQMNVWNSNHCLDNATEKDSKLQMWKCTGGSEQRWLEIFNATGAATFINQNTGWCITAPSVGAGTINMAPCDSRLSTQQWSVFAVNSESPGGSYIVWQNRSSLLCLTTPSVGNGTLPQTAVCDSSDQNDRWHTQ